MNVLAYILALLYVHLPLSFKDDKTHVILQSDCKRYRSLLHRFYFSFWI